MKRDDKGRFVSVSKKSKSARTPGTRMNAQSAGETGLKQSHGYVYEEFLPDLQGQKAAEVFKEMRNNDPTTGAMFFGIEMFLRRVGWFVDSFDDSTEQEKKARFLRECKDDMSTTWPDFIAEIMSMMEHGWSWFEELYKRRLGENPGRTRGKKLPSSKFDDGKIGWRKFEIRSQDSLDRWDFDDEGGIRGMFQRPSPSYELKYVPISKSVLFRTTSNKNNPEGRSVLRNAYRAYYFKKRIEEHEAVGVERDLAGLPFAEVPAEMLSADASDADKETLASIIELVKNVRRDEQEGVIWPQQWDENGNKQYEFKLMASGGTRQFDTNTIISRYDSRIAMVILADFILLGQDAGSNASIGATTTKSGLFQSALSAWLDVIQDVLNNYAVPRLFRLNGDTSGKYPKFRHDEVQKPSLADLATLVAALTGAGAQMFPDVELENWFRDLAQMPLREQADEATAKEDDLRDTSIEAQLAAAKFAIKNPGGPPPPAPTSTGKDPASTPGAPTKTTGQVKSKLPPASRRNTKAVLASQNVAKVVTKKNGVRVVRRKKVSA